MSTVVRRHPDALYMILGQTHPVVRRYEGEIYREALQQRVADLASPTTSRSSTATSSSTNC